MWKRGGRGLTEWGEGVVRWVCIKEMDFAGFGDAKNKKNTFKVFLQSFV